MSAAASSKMRPVAIVGVGSTPFGKLPDRDIVGIAVDACRDAIEDSGLERNRIQSLYLGNFVGERLAGQGALAPMVAGRLGMTGIPCHKV